MAARKPEEAHQLFAAAFSAGDLEALVALYEPGASLVPQPGQVVTGRDGIRQALQGFLALKPKISVETKSVVQSGDLALLRSKWSLTGTGPDGTPMQMSGNGIEIVRRQPDGTWRFIIDHPFGAD
jgi:uncharacterized protein (TIGR02246 family)